MKRILRRLRALFHRDREADLIKAQIEANRRKHLPVRNLQAALRSLRHSQLAR